LVRNSPILRTFPGLQANLQRAGITPESIDLVVISHASPGSYRRLGDEIGRAGVPKAQFVFVDTEWNYWTGSRYESEVNGSPMPDPFKRPRLGQLERTCHRSPTGPGS